MMSQTKCLHDDSPLIKYVMEKSLRLTQEQQGLIEVTSNHSENNMLGDPIALQLTSNLMKLIGAKKVLDVGVFTGASALSAALAIPEDGKVYALDINDDFASIGKPFWKAAGVENKIDLILAPAVETLQKFIDAGDSGTFDFAFIDADKSNYINYYELCLKLIRPGGIIAIDNTIWFNSVFDDNVVPFGQVQDKKTLLKLNTLLKDDQRINISYLTIGDGLTICFKI